MLLAARRLIPTVLLTGAALALSSCSDEAAPAGPGGDPTAVIGTWSATSFVVFGQDLIAQGMVIGFVFDAAGNYSFDVTNDQAGFCDTGPDCSDNGTYTATGTQITLDPGTTDQVVLNYSILGTTMTVTGTVNGVPISATFSQR